MISNESIFEEVKSKNSAGVGSDSVKPPTREVLSNGWTAQMQNSFTERRCYVLSDTISSMPDS